MYIAIYSRYTRKQQFLWLEEEVTKQVATLFTVKVLLQQQKFRSTSSSYFVQNFKLLFEEKFIYMCTCTIYKVLQTVFYIPMLALQKKVPVLVRGKIIWILAQAFEAEIFIDISLMFFVVLVFLDVVEISYQEYILHQLI